MKKAELIGYLHALKDLTTYRAFDDFDDGIEWVLDRIIERAEQLEEPTTAVARIYPQYPTTTIPWSFWPNTWITTNNIELDNPSEFEYNGIKIKKDPLVGPNDWEVKYDTVPNFTVVK